MANLRMHLLEPSVLPQFEILTVRCTGVCLRDPCASGVNEIDNIVILADVFAMLEASAVTRLQHSGTGADVQLESELTDLRAALAKGVGEITRIPSGSAKVLDLLNDVIGQIGNAAGGESVSRAEVVARKEGALRRVELLAAHGGTCSAEQAARRVDMSKPAVLERAENGRLLGLRVLKQNAVRFPVFQFAADGGNLILGLDAVLEELRKEPALDAWAKCNFLLTPRDSLKGDTPLRLLQQGKVKTVVALARRYAN